jgi:predicted RNA-binding Zn-ribbon protein involved in translation (DUF1610 family)
MSISFQCQSCGKKLKAPESAAGSTSNCPGCGAKVRCPVPADDDVVEMSPPEFSPFADLDDDKPYAVTSPAPGDLSASESRRPCPMCGEMILASAAKCRYCNEVFDPALRKAKKPKLGVIKAETRQIARLQKYLVMATLVMLVSYLGMFVLAALARPSSPQGPPQFGSLAPIVAIGLLIVLVAASVAAWVSSVMLAYNLYGIGGAIAFFLLQFLVCINLISLLVINSKATNLLRERGVHVGFFGADMSRLR